MKDKFVDWAVRQNRSMLLVMLGVVAFGIVARMSIPIESEPSIEIPLFVITVPHEGISPDDARRLLVFPLETHLKAMQGIKEINATAAEHMAIVSVEFTVGTNLDAALADVREAVSRARPEFPATAEEPVVQESTTTDYPVLQVNLVGEEISERSLYAAARQLKQRIEMVSEVHTAELQGGREELLEIMINPEQLEAYQLSVEELLGSLQRNNRLIAVGALDSGQSSVAVNVPSVVKAPEDLFDIPVQVSGDTVVTLSEVASIGRGFKDRTSYSHANGRLSMSLFIYRRANANSIETSRMVREAVEAFRPQLPAGVTLFFSQDSSFFAEKQVVELQGNLVTALVLVLVCLLPILRLRNSLIVAAGIPVSLLFSLILLWLLGYSFNFMVMFGMLLGLGLLIDGAIVVVEEADRQINAGAPPRDAYSAAAKRMFQPVIAATATTLAAFVPLLFWPGLAGEFMSYLPITLMMVLGGSLLYALVFAPVLGATFVRRRKTAASEPMNVWDTNLAHVTGLRRQYSRLLGLALRSPVWAVVILLATVWSIFSIHGARDLGILFFNENDPMFAQVSVRARGNLGVEQAYRLVSEVEQTVIETPGIKNLNTFATRGVRQAQGQQMQYEGGSTTDLIGSMYIELVENNERELSGTEILEDIRRRAEVFAGLVIEVRPFESQITAGKPIAIQFSASERDRLAPVVEQVRAHLESEVEGIRDIEDTLPVPGIAWELEVDRAQAAMYGADVSTVGLAAQLVTNGVKLGEYRPDDADDALDIRIRYPAQDRGIGELDDLRVGTGGGLAPLSNFVTREARPRLDALQRNDQRDMHMIRASVGPGVLPDTKVREIRSWIDSQTFDPLVDIRFRGANEEQEESLAFLSKAFSFALLLMFVLLIMQFNSVYQSLLIMLAIVLSTTGVFLGLLITSQPFSAILTGVGVISLAGIVVNDNIVLIDTYNIGRKERPEMDRRSLIMMTGLHRLQPVLLTTVTTIVGLLPLASYQSIDLINRTWTAGGQLPSMWAPFAQAIIFGLGFATLLTLVATPVLLILPQRLREARAQLSEHMRGRSFSLRMPSLPRRRRIGRPG
ncbi:MAG: efflux RND transporter permease subunit [Gammaproteobacteria bacterium]|nr:efflux RND transporter permease subunit [Gammaproteobacteria bacterium]MCY4340417.1 efflux RND transporter permease subunit [Gammaproteobacteria bacterium]